ncbi:MAG TPA: hypothetical protein VFU74_22115 [Actinocrinis sp.]|nr:hypothetical protein [Actinocrinis sp.]
MLTIHNLTLSQKEAAELLALAPDVPPAMSDEAVLAAIGSVLDAHGDSLTACVADLAWEYFEHPDVMSARMGRCLTFASRLTAVAP